MLDIIVKWNIFLLQLLIYFNNYLINDIKGKYIIFNNLFSSFTYIIHFRKIHENLFKPMIFLNKKFTLLTYVAIEEFILHQPLCKIKTNVK